MRDGASAHFKLMCAVCTYVERSHKIKTDNCAFERVEEFKYLGTTLTNQNSIQEEIKSKLKSWNVAIIRCRISCYPKMQRLRHRKL